MIKFYRIHSESPNIRKISIMLKEIGLPYTEVNLESDLDGKFSPDYFEINPNGTVPAIVDTDCSITVFESSAILHYLAEKTGKLIPSNITKKAEVVQWLAFEAANIGPTMSELHHYLITDTGNTPDDIFQRYRSKLLSYFSTLEQRLNNRTYMCDQYSIADIAIFPWTVTFEDMADINLSHYPNISRWSKLVSERPATHL